MTATILPLHPNQRPAPRIWPAIALVLLQWMIILVPALIVPGTMLQFMGMFYGPIIGLLSIFIWWLFFSRLTWPTRWIGLAAFLVIFAIAFVVAHTSMRFALIVVVAPIATTVWAAWTLIGARHGERTLRSGLIACFAVTFAIALLLRSNGLDGSIRSSYALRWSKTAEEKFLASHHSTAASPTTSPNTLTLSEGDWPAFRGPNRDSKLPATSIRTDWNDHPPRQIWRHLIGPGWSSFCVIGDHVYTQEQRGQLEAVVCYQLTTGDELWSHEDQARFTEPLAGPGPRATPTFDAGNIYTFGAKGILNCLDARNGQVVWSRDVAADTGAPLPNWGFSSSPLVANGLVTVITGAKGKTIAAYNAATGQPAWTSGDGWSYASPQISKIDGVNQLLYVTENGAAGLDPTTGQPLWQHSFPLSKGANRATQPDIINDNELLLGAAFGIGTRRIKITHDASQWKDQEVWTSRSIKPYYNDLVIHKNHAYGFDGSTFTCINLDTGKPAWRAGGVYGNGQVLLLPDQDLLLVLSETGEAALVEAKPEAYKQLASFQALNGKTWNHPVISHGKLLVRNGEEIACYALQ